MREAVEVVSGRVYNQQRILDMTKKISKRGRYKASLKEEVAKQAILGIKTVEQIASDYKVSAELVRQWRDQAQEAMADAFRNRNPRERNLEREVETLKSIVCKRTNTSANRPYRSPLASSPRKAPFTPSTSKPPNPASA